ncbi:Gp15 family bacteriophage protein [Enterococcus sp. AZ163]|uniref:Gp15 family bacteriophage protein n=1 Tax=Enterococcus sp. AZ163 TaxID=2774638 RepID=UPI003D2E2901
MFSFAYGLEDKIEIGGAVYELNLSYDRVLRFFDILADSELTDTFRFKIAFKLLLDVDDIEQLLTLEQQYEVIQAIIQEYIVKEKPSVVLASFSKEKERDKEKEYYSVKEDADIIFASFFYDYKIDLLSERGKLHWQKFKALLNNLSESSKLNKVIEIRKWKPSEHTTAEERKQMEELQAFYSLDATQKDAEELMYFNSLSEEEKEVFARERLACMKEGGV